MSEYRPPRRFALVVLVIVAAGGCLGLGYWQWMRFEEAGGNYQNLGYAFQWPAFAFFCIYAYRRFVKLESEEAEAEATGGRRPSESAEPTEIPEELLPTRPRTIAEARADEAAADDDDPEARQTQEYNDYLAQLARRSDRSAQ
ncbi:transcriptional regulator [Rhodococcus chondri]|uniref:Transcriptional regulator n=1 Tax=Rhodococcus chondri TaxID=3065941 RepID=A0ABU7JWW1_9NOCA|nr:transcriptional regulator [Rhodococcus sp. CC-R104]MEE2034511.1 transcriptional regulator [Rhodococcus sp. CC-R104]